MNKQHKEIVHNKIELLPEKLKPSVLSKQEEKLNRIKMSKEEEKRLLDAWKENASWNNAIIDDAYLEGENYIRMVAQHKSTGFIYEGFGGLGKSFLAISTLKSENITDFAYADSYTSAVSLYAWLYKNKDKVCVMDDIAGWDVDKRIIAYLKGALWEVNGERLVRNMTMKPPLDEMGNPIPDVFEFTGGIIILTNALNKKSPHLRALLTRVNYSNLKLSYDQKISILQKIVQQNYNKLTLPERNEILEYLKENTKSNQKELNFRSLIKMYQFFEFSKDNKKPQLWKELSKRMLNLSFIPRDKNLVLIEELERDTSFKTQEERIARYVALSGMSRMSYFRYKKKFELNGEV